MMAASWFHSSKSIIKRSAGRSVVAAAAYRTGSSITCEREMLTHDYTRKRGVVEVFVTTPDGKPGVEWAHDVARLVNAMEAHEKRKDSQLGHEWTIALPAALDARQRSELAHDLGQTLSELYGVAVIGAVHAPGREGDERNYHVHLLFTTREVEADGQLGAKVTSLTGLKTGPEEVRRYRFIVAEFINGALEDAGSDERVDARSFADRGIDVEPTSHLGPAASAMERRGGDRSDRGDINREILEDRLRWQQEQAQPEVTADLERDLAARFGDPLMGGAEPSAAYQAETERVAGLIAEARAGASVPADVVEHATAGMEPVDEDTASGGRNPPLVPIGWISRMKRLAAELMELLRDEGGEPSIDRLQADAPQPDMPAVETYPGVPDAGHAVDHHPHVSGHADLHADHPTGWQVHLKTAGEKLKGFADQVRQRAGTFIGNQRGSVPDFDPLPQADPFAEIFSAWLNEAGDGQDMMDDGMFPVGSFPDEPDVLPDTPEPEPDNGLDYDL